MQILSSREIEKIISDTWEGFLGLVDGDKPYCIPVAHVYHNKNLYVLFPKEGRKTKCIERNKNACYLIHTKIDDVYHSILIEGYLQRVEDPEEIKLIVEKFYDMVFPRDPFFKEFKKDFILNVCLGSSKAGLYKLVPSSVSGFKKS